MKTVLAVLVGLVLITAVAVLAVPPVRDEVEWRVATAQDTLESYDAYLNSWADGAHAADARQAIHDIRWEAARAAGSVPGFETYLRDEPEGTHAAEARRAIDDLRWQEAIAAQTVADFNRYLRDQPEGAHAAEARRAIEELRWQEAIAARSLAGYEAYLRSYPDGIHVTQAREAIEDLHWHEAEGPNIVVSYQAYLVLYPSGRFAPEAEARITSLRADDGVFEAAVVEGTLEAVESFLAQFPGHRREAEARAILRDLAGRDLVDLIAERKVAVVAKGAGIEAVELTIRSLADHALTARVPVGTLFVPARSFVQTMAVTRELTVPVGAGDETLIIVDTACASISRDVPGEEDRFTMKRPSSQLRTLLVDLDWGATEFAVIQAAVWIVTDDADFDALGRLRSFGQDSVERAIDVEETAAALRILDEAGIDVTKKAIWRDRNRILKGLPEGELKAWLREKIGG